MRAALQSLGIERERNPNVGLAARLEICRRAPELKIRRQHTDDRVAVVVQRDGLARDVAVRAEPIPAMPR